MEKQIKEKVAISSLLTHYINKGKNILVEYKKREEIMLIKRRTKKGIITIKKEMPLKEVIKKFY